MEKFYKLGLFYFNKDDSRLFVPKKIKWFGWTINFANKYSIIVVLLTIFFVFALYKLNLK